MWYDDKSGLASKIVEYKEFAKAKYGSETRTIKNQDSFGHSGIGYSMRSSIGFAARPLPKESVLADDGPIVIPKSLGDQYLLLGYLNSTIGISLLKIWQGGKRSGLQRNQIMMLSIPYLLDLIIQLSPSQIGVHIFIVQVTIRTVYT